jgi:membrane-bound serine protease (ClpP class)
MKTLRVGLFILLFLAGLAGFAQEGEKVEKVEKVEEVEKHVPDALSPAVMELGQGGDEIVYHLKFLDVVDLGIAPFVRRAIEEAEEAGAAALVLEMDTPGGRVDAAIQIKDALLDAKITTICFIHKEAISAGALIAFAHDYIIWSEGSTMGAATPIQMGGGGKAEPVEEKMTSFMRAVMRATAEARDRDGLVAEAMVDASIVVPGFSEEGKLLTATYEQAEELGLLDGRAESLEQLLTDVGLGDATVVTVTENWAERIARILTHPVVSSLLMTFGFLGLLIEFYTAGFGITGLIGLICLLLFFLGHMVVHLAGWEEILIFVIGLVLIGVEVFVIPGFGIAGVLGLVAVVIALILSLVELELDIAFHAGLLEQALVQVFAAIILAGVGSIAIIRYLPSIRPVRGLILTRSLRTEDGAVAREIIPDNLIGRVTTADTDLRPVGVGRIDGQRVELQTRGGYLRKGARVRVVSVKDSILLVRAEPEEEGEGDDVQ